MIGRLTGQLAEKNPPQIVLDVNGVGYEIDVPMSTFYNLPANGEKATLLTHFAVREDGHYLYGFLTEAERFAFRHSSYVHARHGSARAGRWCGRESARSVRARP